MRNTIYLRFLVIFLILFTFSLEAEASSVPKKKQIIVIFRYDDYSSVSYTDIEVKLIDTFKTHDIPCVFGVIPYTCAVNQEDTHPQDVVPLTKSKVDILKKAVREGVLEVALHGYSHQAARPRDRYGYTEFLGLDYNIQKERIAKGKKYLEELLETPITIFIPPWNSYDSNTLLILERLEFVTISADVEGYADKSSTLKFLPTTCFISQLRDKVELARRISEIQPIIVALIHPYYFIEADSQRGGLRYQDFEGLIKWITSQRDVRVLSFGQTIKMVDDLTARRFINYKFYLKISRIIQPYFLKKIFSKEIFSLNGIYISQNTVYKMIIKLLLLCFAILATSIAIVFFGGLVLFPRIRIAIVICRYAMPVILIYKLLDLIATQKDAITTVILGGAYIGILWSINVLKKC